MRRNPPNEDRTPRLVYKHSFWLIRSIFFKLWKNTCRQKFLFGYNRQHGVLLDTSHDCALAVPKRNSFPFSQNWQRATDLFPKRKHCWWRHHGPISPDRLLSAQPCYSGTHLEETFRICRLPCRDLTSVQNLEVISLTFSLLNTHNNVL